MAHRHRRDGRLAVRGDLDATQLREVEANDRRKVAVHILVDLVAPRVLVVVGGRAVQTVDRRAHVAHNLVDDVGRLIHASLRVSLGERGLVAGEVVVDVIVDVVVGQSLHVDVRHVDPVVRVATVLHLALEDVLAAHLESVSIRLAHDHAVRVDVCDNLLVVVERDHLRVLHCEIVQPVGVVGGQPLVLLVAREDVEEFRVVLTQLRRVIHQFGVLVVHKKEAVRLVGREALDKTLTAWLVEVLLDGLVEHRAVRLGRVGVARVVHVGDRRGAEEPLVVVVVHIDHRALICLGDAVGVLRLLDVLLEREGLGDLVGERDDDVLAERLGDVDDDAARLVVQLLEVRDVGALVGVVEEDKRLILEDGLDLEHREVVVGLEEVLEFDGESPLLILRLDGLEHLGDGREVGRVHF